MSNINKVEVGGTEYGIEGVAADSKDDTVTFTSSDVADGSATSWTTVTKVSSGEKHSSLFAKMSQMFKNVRYLYKLLGTTDVSSFFGGSGQDITGALATLNTNIGSHTVAKNVPSNAVFTDHTYSALPDVYVNTDGGTAAKVGISPNFVLRDQARFTVRIANTNTYEGTLTLNINDTGAKEITIMGASTADELPAGDYSVFYSLSANTYYFFLYDQLGFHTVAKDVPYDAKFTDTTYSGLPDVYVGTAAGTQTKVGTSPNYVLRSGSRFTVRIKNANSYNGLIKLNINSTGAKNVYINGAVSSSSNKTLPAGDYSVYYNGSYYYFNTSDEITSLNSALTTKPTEIKESFVCKLYYSSQATALGYTREQSCLLKIGHLVFLTFRIAITNVGSGSGLRISNTNNTLPYKPNSGVTGKITFNGKTFSVGSGYNYEYFWVDNLSGTPVSNSDISNGACTCTIVYSTDD